jgi:hypothetical protein
MDHTAWAGNVLPRQRCNPGLPKEYRTGSLGNPPNLLDSRQLDEFLGSRITE